MRKFIIACGGYLHHIGMLVDHTEKTLESLKRIPGLERWTTGESSWSQEEMAVGGPVRMRCSVARILDSVLVEVIEPIEGACTHTHFEDYLHRTGGGLHHICYGIPHYEDYLKIYEYLTGMGCTDVMHGRKRDGAGRVTDEFCYLEVEEGKLYLELSLTRYKWGYEERSWSEQ